MKKVEVVAAIIKFNDKILCVKRGNSKFDYLSNKYEFPGGKIELGESNEVALKREIIEELDMEIDIKEKYLTVNHFYNDFEILMHSYICFCKNTKFKLNEHIDFKWLNINELNSLIWADADLPIVEKLLKSLKN